MRKRLALLILLIYLSSSSICCAWFVDARAKRATSIIAAEAKVALAKASATEHETEAYLSLKRIAPVLENLKAYLWGEKPMEEAVK